MVSVLLRGSGLPVGRRRRLIVVVVWSSLPGSVRGSLGLVVGRRVLPPCFFWGGLWPFLGGCFLCFGGVFGLNARLFWYESMVIGGVSGLLSLWGGLFRFLFMTPPSPFLILVPLHGFWFWMAGGLFGGGHHVLVWSIWLRGFFFLGPGVSTGSPNATRAAMLALGGMLRVSRSLSSL